jgi:hypothetical protein
MRLGSHGLAVGSLHMHRAYRKRNYRSTSIRYRWTCDSNFDGLPHPIPHSFHHTTSSKVAPFCLPVDDSALFFSSKSSEFQTMIITSKSMLSRPFAVLSLGAAVVCCAFAKEASEYTGVRRIYCASNEP